MWRKPTIQAVMMFSAIMLASACSNEESGGGTSGTAQSDGGAGGDGTQGGDGSQGGGGTDGGGGSDGGGPGSGDDGGGDAGTSGDGGPGTHSGPAATGRLAVVWTSADLDVAERMVFMYTHNAKLNGWFDEVELIVWGPSQRLLVDTPSLHDDISDMLAAGVVIEACRACADTYGIAGDLEALGVTVKYMGVPLSDMIKGDWKVITF